MKRPEQQTKTDLKTITVEGQRERAALEHQVRPFVSATAAQPFGDSLARWENPTSIWPQVAGLPRDDGEFILARLSRIAALSPVAPSTPERAAAHSIHSPAPDWLITKRFDTLSSISPE
jgi:hypothetical protein